MIALAAICAVGQSIPRAAGELAFAIRSEPHTLDPAKVDEQASETIRYLTAGVLVRFNRISQQAQPELAENFHVSPDGKLITFKLREGLRFSDGSRLNSADVVWSLRRVLAADTKAPVAEEFLSPAEVTVEAPDESTIRVHLAKRVIGVEKVFDEIAIEPENRASEGKVTAGPFTLEEYKRGQYLLLSRNPHYFKHDGKGNSLPYASSIRLDILNNREQEISLFQRGAYDFIDGLSPEYFGLLAGKAPQAARDLGPSLNTEQLWFNQSSMAALPDYEKAWFHAQGFRVAVSEAIHRSDLARIAFDGHATPAYTFISPVNKQWHNDQLTLPRENSAEASHLLTSSGFHRSGNLLYDSSGHQVKFSIVTNAGNAPRQKMATLIQQDLMAVGIEVTVVTLDFPALIERLMHKQDYEACLLGLSDVEPDPNSMINIWLSSSPNHQWNPSEKTPFTPWEAEIDALMLRQATALSQAERKQAIDRVQQIVADQQPFIYLVYPNALEAISPHIAGVQASILAPRLVWNVEWIQPAGIRR
jgi:peptide/nickel transport system substrate-binding protein